LLRACIFLLSPANIVIVGKGELGNFALYVALHF